MIPTVRKTVPYFQKGDMVVLAVSLACLTMFIYQLYVIVVREKLLTIVHRRKTSNFDDRSFAKSSLKQDTSNSSMSFSLK